LRPAALARAEASFRRLRFSRLSFPNEFTLAVVAVVRGATKLQSLQTTRSTEQRAHVSKSTHDARNSGAERGVRATRDPHAAVARSLLDFFRTGDP
jgi:hypothetical protein